MGWNVLDALGRLKVSDAAYPQIVNVIFDQTLAGAQASIDVSNIPQGYAHLKVLLMSRVDAVTTNVDINLRLNNDSGGNYDREGVHASPGTTVAGAVAEAQTSGFVGWAPGTTAPNPSAAGSPIEIDLFDYARVTTFYKSGFNRTFLRNSASGGQNHFVAAGWQWRSTAAINRITLTPSSGNFVAGTRITIYAYGVS